MLRVVVIVLTALTPWMVQATPSQEDLHQLRLKVTDAMTGFYMYQGLEADIKYAARTDAALQDAHAALTRITADSETNEELNGAALLTEHWNNFTRLMTANRTDIVERGYPDIRLVDEMGEACLQLVTSAAEVSTALDAEQGANSERSEQVAQLARSLAFQMTDITAQYTGRGTSNLGQVFVGYHTVTPKEMARSFEKQLSALEEAVANEQILEVTAIRNKWEFLHRSIANYNENSVPFLVLNYNDSIVSALHKLASQE
ncbi:MAG: hypothetical protein VXZ05_00350 [Pseudomonadota bacterium]|nr:hypothetical protein [Pseudomonadota bacterium]